MIQSAFGDAQVEAKEEGSTCQHVADLTTALFLLPSESCSRMNE